ncbi:hypothetical protein ACT048_12315 [Ectopseudomonas khazarica]|uniref:hypothetical protein n=1 Tax=Ectopseudomonas khazarica TaxID=2502979 RepID=UPI00403435FD
MSSTVTLREFSSDELIFDEEETKVILKFIFKTRAQSIDNTVINNSVRSFAQALLLEAIDESYSLGYIEALFRSTMHPGASVKSVLTKFGKKAAKHWFKKAKTQNLNDIMIYDRVRDRLAQSFVSQLLMYSGGASIDRPYSSAIVNYISDTHNHTIWG